MLGQLKVYYQCLESRSLILNNSKYKTLLSKILLLTRIYHKSFNKKQIKFRIKRQTRTHTMIYSLANKCQERLRYSRNNLLFIYLRVKLIRFIVKTVKLWLKYCRIVELNLGTVRNRDWREVKEMLLLGKIHLKV